ncbi:MAG TPA: hypothetical protein VGX76_20125 [Pirellulales bacterium]|nr:hypothetical protein [Pirellulales bacterium]
MPYYQNGRVAPGCAPLWDGKRLDFDAWDARFGPLLDGTAFDDLPRRGVPLACFYLPLHENWPTPVEGNYNGDFWADRAFPAACRAAFVAASRQLAEHCDARGWHDTLFQCFLNGKNSFKQEGWSRGLSPWLWTSRPTFKTTGRCVILAGHFTRVGFRRAARRRCSFAVTSRGPNGSATRSTKCSITTSWAAASADTTGW